jgi:hypothetical protein
MSDDPDDFQWLTNTVPRRFVVSLVHEYKSKMPFRILSGDNDALIEHLRKQSQERVPSKTDLYLYSPALYDPLLSETTDRGKANIVVTNGIWLDNDGGDLTVDAFVRLLPDVKIVTYTSYNSSVIKPRWRVFIPTTALMPVGVYEAITHDIIRRVETAGYPLAKPDPDKPGVRAHGFDTGKLHATSLFHRPSLAKDPGGSHFQIFDGQPLDPYVWMASLIDDDDGVDEAVPPEGPVDRDRINDEPEEPVMPRGTIRNKIKVDDAAVAAATDRWRDACNHPGEGNDRFFTFAIDLIKAGMSVDDIEATLRFEHQYGRSPIEREAQIRSIMDSLRSYGLGSLMRI